ncbi:MAG: peptidoglycan DD-metalloendopeptidase family protein [Desulfobulbaceae bacterium]|nr:peptidoglycan DD-metalloendopeptidase family protein [Desulfobulbaceae bacterium]
MDEQLHIIIAGDSGKVVRLPCNKKKLRLIIGSSTAVLVFLAVTSIFSISFYTKHRNSSEQISKLQEQLDASTAIISQHNKTQEVDVKQLEAQVAQLELDKQTQAAAFKEEKDALLSNAVSELNERSELIEKIVGTIGIKLSKEDKDTSKNSGGPFIQYPREARDELLHKADKYLKTIRYLPFGRPVAGPITSRFGRRKDPLNKKSAFHEGIDFKGKRGDKIYATADGVVKRAFRNGGYGNYVQISHGNGYKTSFSHMQKFVVKRGEKIKRGQAIGLIGSSGRSTGPHLHYEVTLDGKPINPYNFMKVAKLSK